MHDKLTKPPLAAIGAALLSIWTGAPALAATGTDGPWLIRGALSAIDPKPDNGDIAPGSVEVRHRFGPTFNLAYFFTPRFAVDVLGGLPFRHDFSIDRVEAGSVKHLPPVVTLQYHFAPADDSFRPYLGVGLNYTFFFDEKLKGSNADLDLDNSFGLAAQAGFDVPLSGNWLLGFDLRFVDIDSKATVNGAGIGKIHVDPFVYSLSLGYRF